MHDQNPDSAMFMSGRIPMFAGEPWNRYRDLCRVRVAQNKTKRLVELEREKQRVLNDYGSSMATLVMRAVQDSAQNKRNIGMIQHQQSVIRQQQTVLSQQQSVIMSMLTNLTTAIMPGQPVPMFPIPIAQDAQVDIGGILRELDSPRLPGMPFLPSVSDMDTSDAPDSQPTNLHIQAPHWYLDVGQWESGCKPYDRSGSNATDSPRINMDKFKLGSFKNSHSREGEYGKAVMMFKTWNEPTQTNTGCHPPPAFLDKELSGRWAKNLPESTAKVLKQFRRTYEHIGEKYAADRLQPSSLQSFQRADMDQAFKSMTNLNQVFKNHVQRQRNPNDPGTMGGRPPGQGGPTERAKGKRKQPLQDSEGPAAKK